MLQILRVSRRFIDNDAHRKHFNRILISHLGHLESLPEKSKHLIEELQSVFTKIEHQKVTSHKYFKGNFVLLKTSGYKIDTSLLSQREAKMFSALKRIQVLVLLRSQGLIYNNRRIPPQLKQRLEQTFSQLIAQTVQDL